MDTVLPGYHAARAVQGFMGAGAPDPSTLAGKTVEALTEASFNELDHQVIDWDTVTDPSEP